MQSLPGKLKDVLKERELITFLRAHHTQDISHSQGTFFEHLLGTYRRLKKWGCEKSVCYAGLFHSIYGTQIFKHSTISYGERWVIKNLIGKEAERLAYLFSVSKRPPALIEAINTNKLYDTLEKQNVPVTKKELSQLIEIECANLIDQKKNIYFAHKLLEERENKNIEIGESVVCSIKSLPKIVRV